MRKVLSAVAIAAVLLSVGGPASADPPAELSAEVTFVDVNPCSGLDHEVTLRFDVRLHRHRENLVVTIRRSGSTSDGFEMIAGAGNVVENRNVFHETFVDQWRSPDGAKFAVHGQVVLDLDAEEPRVDRFSLECIGRG